MYEMPTLLLDLRRRALCLEFQSASLWLPAGRRFHSMVCVILLGCFPLPKCWLFVPLKQIPRIMHVHLIVLNCSKKKKRILHDILSYLFLLQNYTSCTYSWKNICDIGFCLRGVRLTVIRSLHLWGVTFTVVCGLWYCGACQVWLVPTCKKNKLFVE